MLRDGIRNAFCRLMMKFIIKKNRHIAQFMSNFFTVLISLLVFFSAGNLLAQEIKTHLSLQGETLNFEIAGQKNWNYDLKRTQDKGQYKVQLYVQSLEQNTLEKIKNIQNPLVKNIEIKPKSVDGKTLIEFTLANSNIETFDYLTDKPSKLIIDFYEADSDIAELSESQEQKTSAVSKKTIAKENTKTNKNNKTDMALQIRRKPATSDFFKIEKDGGIETSIISHSGLYDGGDTDFSRFAMKENDYKEESVIRSKNNYYLKYPILETEFSFWKKMKENPPIYDFKPENTEENKQVLLIKKLFDKKRYLVFKKTVEWFTEKFPNSKYLEVISYMMGDALIELAQEEKNDAIYEEGIQAYIQALNKYPDSVLAERTSLMLGMMSIDKLDYMTAIRRLNTHIENKKYDAKISKQYAQIALAYGFSKINKLEDAITILNKLQKDSKDPLVQADAAVRKGDFNFTAKKYEDAINAYNEALKKYNFVATAFPSAYFNKMEAQFLSQQYLASHQSALNFARNYPNHEFAPYALTRVGELLDIMGADQTKAVGAFLETHFRYGDSPKTIVARLHMLSTRMKSMKNEELVETLKKMDDLTVKSELANVDQFKIAMIADGFARRKDYKKAIEILSEFFQQNPLRPDSKQVTLRIIRNINDEMKNLADQANYKGLLKTYQMYADTWLKAQARIDTDYLLGLAYQNAGAYQVAEDKFKTTLAKILSIQGTSKEKEAYVNEYLPSVDSLRLRLSQNYFDNKKFQDSYRDLEQIKNPMNLTEAEQIQRVILASQLFEKKQDFESSERYLSELVRLWKGEQSLELPAVLRLANLQVQRKNSADAIKNFEKGVEILLNQEKPAANLVSDFTRDFSRTLINENQTTSAIQFLNKIINKFGEQLPMAEEKYLLGDLYFKNGETKNAERAWLQIKEDNTGIYQKLAQEKLQQAKWDEGYKKHIKRIPAMSKSEEFK